MSLFYISLFPFPPHRGFLHTVFVKSVVKIKKAQKKKFLSLKLFRHFTNFLATFWLTGIIGSISISTALSKHEKTLSKELFAYIIFNILVFTVIKILIHKTQMNAKFRCFICRFNNTIDYI